MSFNRLLYFAATVVGAVCLGISFENTLGILVGGALVFLSVLMTWISTSSRGGIDQTSEFFLLIIFAMGLISEIFVWNWVLPLVIFMYFGTVFVNWALSGK